MAWGVNVARYSIVFTDYLSYWIDMEPAKGAVAMVGFLVIPWLFNVLRVRRYGEIEFWLTLFTIIGIFVVIFVGFVIAAGGITTPLLGLDAAYRPVPCSENAIANVSCVAAPGFTCTLFHDIN